MPNVGIWQLLIVFAIILLLFGGKRLRSLGSDLGEALRGFRKSVSDDDDKDGSPKGLDSPGSSREQAESERDHDRR